MSPVCPPPCGIEAVRGGILDGPFPGREHAICRSHVVALPGPLLPNRLDLQVASALVRALSEARHVTAWGDSTCAHAQ